MGYFYYTLNRTEESYWERVKTFYEFLNSELFGNMFTYLIIFTIILLFFMVICDKREFQLAGKEEIQYFMLMGIPILMYFLLVSKMSVYIASRYIFPIYAVILICIFYLMYHLIGLFMREKARITAMLLLITLFTVNGWKDIGWPYLYTSSQKLLDKAAEYSDIDSVIVYDSVFRTQPTYLEVENYRSVTFIPAGNLDLIDSTDLTECTELMVLLRSGTSNTTNILEKFIDKFPMLDRYEKIGGYAYTETYHLFGSDKN